MHLLPTSQFTTGERFFIPQGLGKTDKLSFAAGVRELKLLLDSKDVTVVTHEGGLAILENILNGTERRDKCPIPYYKFLGSERTMRGLLAAKHVFGGVSELLIKDVLDGTYSLAAN